VNLATLFCAPSDVWDLLSTEGVDLRLDDHNLASGQIIATASDSPIGSTSINVNPLPVPLLNGATLTFEGSNTLTPVQVQLTAVANVNATSLSVQALTADVPLGAQARDSGVNVATAQRLLVSCRRGTSEVKLWCSGRYDDSALKLSGSVCDWAATIAAKFLCIRRAQGCPKGLMADYKEIVERMKMVQSGQLMIEDIGTRGVDWPTVTNITVNPVYDSMRARVEPNISEQTPTSYNQYVDWNSIAWLEF
jgi:hypothetical protein